ncbi:CLUMA_CG014880, isoform A [Clunio marinus]|uniref:non-specific serine/threonine protein kinase n=1 Tax=Clunio marinus TaxID=568069 RepID=A0A1J1IPL6_9DIPT|nr:CLUMA_CG014880, isoform A [Clunio marinus]
MKVVCLVFLIVLNFSVGFEENFKDCTEVSRAEEPLLVLSTLSGSLIAIDPVTGETRWTQEDEPSVRADTNINNYSSSVYLPDPVSGSLYKLQSDGNELKKLPYTIPELVNKSPCKSSDGILYSGKKSDTWFMIDPKTGNREFVMGFGSKPKISERESIGFATSRAVYLGRTQYTVLMYDSMSKESSKPWNITFYDYTSHTMDPEISQKYEFIHVTSSTSGKIVTIDRKTGGFLWERLDIKSPIVSVFLLSRDGFLSVPFTPVAEEVIGKVIDYSKSDGKSDFKLYETVFVGESKGGLFKSDTLYAIHSYVDDNTPTIKQNSMNLLEGPNVKTNENDNKKPAKSNKRNYIIFGHYDKPTIESMFDTIESQKSGDKQLSVDSDNSVWYVKDTSKLPNQDKIIIPDHNSEKKANNNISEKNKHEEIIETKRKYGLLKTLTVNFKNWFDNEENKVLKLLMVILIGIVITMFWYFHTTVRQLREQSQNGSKTLIPNSSDSKGSYGVESLNTAGELIEVGKITFNPQNVLGKGCEGTFVFKGTFEKRDVAVKRLLPDCFTLADREVSLLRESDTHENVVRYFCTESDRQFRYIAVELCAATLQDYIEGKNSSQLKQLISVKEVLYQATNGLSHLHHLNIVHRDIKPANVLISLPDKKNRVRALISDFGLCKKMNIGKSSFSKRSGVTGTDGWIAPEMIKGHRTTIAVDIFSMGCVYYYVLSNGDHLFGDAIKRQANILSHEFDMTKLMSQKKKPYENILAKELITDMIRNEASQRPSCDAVLKHPLFWREEKILGFLQDVSDRIEKLDVYTDPLRTLEKNAKVIVRDDWSLHVDESITEDLRRYRGYLGISVRDLLRALRNKKHHYHELSADAQRVLGTIPSDFVKYWITLFPYLLSHSYHAMELCSKENIFKRYYSPLYVFTKPDYIKDENYDNIELRDIFDANCLNYNKSPKKENRQPVNNNQNKIEKSKRGSYNFLTPAVTNGGASNGVFITRQDMLVPEKSQKGAEKRRKKTAEEKIVWTLPN